MACIEQAAAEQLFHTYSDTIWRIALNYTRSAADADDITQNALLRCMRSDTNFESEEHRRAWVIRIAINESKRWLANPWHRLMASACQPDDIAPQAAELSGQARALYDALMALPARYRLPLYLFYYEDQSAAQIAEMLGISISGVTTRLSRGRQKLKQQLEGVFDDDQQSF